MKDLILYPFLHSIPSSGLFFKPQRQQAYSPLYVACISFGASWEILLKHQDFQGFH